MRIDKVVNTGVRCNLCEEGIVEHEYVLCDGSVLYICDKCGQKLYGVDFEPLFESRLFHVIMLLEYVGSK